MKKIIMGAMIVTSSLLAGSFSQGIEYLNNNSEKKAYDTFFSLAKSGDVDSQTMLGEMYLDGIGIGVDQDKAFYWISKAAHSGDKEAEYLLGFMYENGISVAVNLPRAVELYKSSADKGDLLAKYNLAIILKEGKGGVEKDVDKAYNLLSSIQKNKNKLIYQASL